LSTISRKNELEKKNIEERKKERLYLQEVIQICWVTGGVVGNPLEVVEFPEKSSP
jgi:hypothetical protein